MRKATAILILLSIIFVKCSPYRYGTPSVMPTGKGELKKKQIKRDLTN